MYLYIQQYKYRVVGRCIVPLRLQFIKLYSRNIKYCLCVFRVPNESRFPGRHASFTLHPIQYLVKATVVWPTSWHNTQRSAFANGGSSLLAFLSLYYWQQNRTARSRAVHYCTLKYIQWFRSPRLDHTTVWVSVWFRIIYDNNLRQCCSLKARARAAGFCSTCNATSWATYTYFEMAEISNHEMVAFW